MAAIGQAELARHPARRTLGAVPNRTIVEHDLGMDAVSAFP